MNCRDCEQLFDAHLDGELGGSLRLEFDAHRLRCPHCQRALAMLEAIGHVIAGDDRPATLSADFTDRVMAGLKQPQPQTILRFPKRRVALIAAAAIQVAAVFGFVAFIQNRQTVAPIHIAANAPVDVRSEMSPTPENIKATILGRVERQVRDLHAAGNDMTYEFSQLGRFLDINLPDDVARATADLATMNPWMGVLNALFPAERDDAEVSSGGADQYSL